MRVVMVGFLLLAATACGGSDSPTGPSANASWKPTAPPFVLSRGDQYRITFRINAATWSGSAAPDQLFVFPGAGEYDGNVSSGSGFAVEVFDGARQIGTAAEREGCPLLSFVASSPSDCTQYPIDFSTIQSGTIDGRIQLRFRGTQARVQGLFTLSLVRRSDSRVIQNGVSITAQELFQ